MPYLLLQAELPGPVKLLIVLAGLVAFGYAVYWLNKVVIQAEARRQEQRGRALEAALAGRGFTFTHLVPPAKLGYLEGFSLIKHGLNGTKKLWNLLERAPAPGEGGPSVALVDYTYTIMVGQYIQTRAVSAIHLELPPGPEIPAFTLSPEHGVLQRLGQALGVQDFDFAEFPRFSNDFQLQGRDEAAVRRYFTPALITTLEARGAHGLTIEGRGRELLVFREERVVEPANLPAWLEEGLEVGRIFAA
jgi:hypothetical protein